MIIDCGTCVMQHTAACDDCIVTALLDPVERPLHLDEIEAEAIGNLTEVGLVAPLRLVTRVDDAREAAG